MTKPVSFLSQTFADYGNETTAEKASYSVAVTTLTAANLVAETAKHTALYDAVAAVSLGVNAKKETVVTRTTVAGAHATDKDSQREKKWLIRYRGDASFDAFQTEIPCADLNLLATDSEFMDETSDEYIALKAAFEAVVRSPNDASETVTMGSVQFVGRRL